MTCRCGNNKDFKVLSSTLFGASKTLQLHKIVKCACGLLYYESENVDSSKVQIKEFLGESVVA